MCQRDAFRLTCFPSSEFTKCWKKIKRVSSKRETKKLPPDVNSNGVFACNELDLKEVQVYGFDYDYTLACYKPSMDYLLYNLGRDILIKKHKYPEKIAQLEYKDDFAVRGLHYDIEKGLLLKLDSFLQIQLGTVYRGLHPVPDDEVLRIYKNRIIPIAYVESQHKHSQDGPHRQKMVQLADLFSVPEMGLLCNVTEYFLQNHIDYHPEILFRDVKNSVQSCHPIMHQLVANNVSDYLEPNKDLTKFFDRLKAANKKMFLVTNSPFHFVNKGMKFLVGDDWKYYFDVVIVQARKPRFFTDESRPLRVYDEIQQTQLWDRYEIENLNKPEFKENANWLQMLTTLIEEHQDYDGEEVQDQLAEWMRERDQLRNAIKRVFNKQFGSVFRTYHNPTYFSRRLFRFADIYMSSITNLLYYSNSHTFYPRRGVMPHEYISYFV
ncbi:hypothetical protein G9C98_001660 [Cotesia typhae]|uniref:5'-nucleotidase domain-containing protein 3 n=1 Tax=Cotesia typhae TaxID=2053667 RepID=A0A8J5QVV3_9HYME|nr:hypothetical protein G9C98_001660 [Cotesia typhae]